jgi:hypothetical protein
VNIILLINFNYGTNLDVLSINTSNLNINHLRVVTCVVNWSLIIKDSPKKLNLCSMKQYILTMKEIEGHGLLIWESAALGFTECRKTESRLWTCQKSIGFRINLIFSISDNNQTWVLVWVNNYMYVNDIFFLFLATWLYCS